MFDIFNLKKKNNSNKKSTLNPIEEWINVPIFQTFHRLQIFPRNKTIAINGTILSPFPTTSSEDVKAKITRHKVRNPAV